MAKRLLHTAQYGYFVGKILLLQDDDPQFTELLELDDTAFLFAIESAFGVAVKRKNEGQAGPLTEKKGKRQNDGHNNPMAKRGKGLTPSRRSVDPTTPWAKAIKAVIYASCSGETTVHIAETALQTGLGENDSDKVSTMLEDVKIATEDAVCKLLEIEDVVSALSKRDIPKINFDALRHLTEADLQEKIVEAWGKVPSANAVDTHASHKFEPVCLSPGLCQDREGRAVSGVYPFTGRPDLSLTSGPVYLEIKARPREQGGQLETSDAQPTRTCSRTTALDIAIVEQSIWRAASRAWLSHHLSRVVVFAVASSGWLVYFQRSTDTSGYPKQKLHILRIPANAIPRLWAALAAKPSEWFLTSDGPLVVEALQAMKLNAALCGVYCYGASMSRVYTITLPKRLKRCMGVCVTEAADFALKVIPDARSFSKEAGILKCISLSTQEGFYALGSFAPGKEVDWFREHSISSRSTKKIEDKYRCEGARWWKSKATAIGGAIIMVAGTALWQRHAKPSDMWIAGCKALHVMHEAGIVHCDLRPNNFVWFDNELHVVDYSVAERVSVDKTASVTIVTGSGQASYVGVRLKGRTGPVQWRVTDDLEMLHECCSNPSKYLIDGSEG